MAASYALIASFCGRNREEGKEYYHIYGDKYIYTYTTFKMNSSPVNVYSLNDIYTWIL